MAIQIRRGTKAEWGLNNSNIVEGEPVIALDSEEVFVGTGSGTYVQLASVGNVDSSVKTYISEVTEPTINKYTNYVNEINVTGSSGTKSILLDTPIPAGTYTISCRYTTTHSGKVGRIQFSNSQTAVISTPNVVGSANFPAYDSTTDGYVFTNITISETAYSFRVLAATSASASSGQTAKFEDLMFVSGSSQMYNFHVGHGAVDDKFRSVYLYPVVGAVDDTPRILRALQNYSHVTLMPGDYYVSQLTMPVSTTLKGVGYSSHIHLIPTADESNFVLYPNAYCTVKNLSFVGNSLDTSIQGNEIGITYAGTSREKVIIDGCYFETFNHSGIFMNSTTAGVAHNCLISSCYFLDCYYGLYIYSNSEYHNIVNCNFNLCHVGVNNRGGNNKFANCGFDSNDIGMDVNDDQGSNQGHGCLTGCTFNHNGNNAGYALKIRGTGRMTVTGCQFHYGILLLDSTNGNMITGCTFGADAFVEVNKGTCSIMNGCILRDTDNTITVTDNTKFKVVNCYYRNGNDVEI